MSSREALWLQRNLDSAREDHRISQWQAAGMAVLWVLLLGSLITATVLAVLSVVSADACGAFWLGAIVIGAGLSILTYTVYDGWDSTRRELRSARHASEDAALSEAGYL